MERWRSFKRESERAASGGENQRFGLALPGYPQLSGKSALLPRLSCLPREALYSPRFRC
jgi:hypothetical protein